MNIDTDNDGRPDVNLVILKEWKPTKCITLDDIQYASGISAKAEINIDVNGDLIPDIDIDNKGDFQPYINISEDGKTAHVNIAEVCVWVPQKNHKKGTFLYDSIGKDQEEYKPMFNIDTDGDGLPDLNIDLDGDKDPDINIDTDGDWIPDINVDKDGDGIADENIIKITEWKPEHNASEPFPYDIMHFDEILKPDDGNDPVDHPDTDVKGNYYSGNMENIGGALTGDATRLSLYAGQCLLAVGLLSYLSYKRGNKTHKR